jgi:FixJ family two-component response regulator
MHSCKVNARTCLAALVLDVRLPGLSGLDFQSELAKMGTELPIIFMTGHGDIPMTVRAMKAGAVEFLTKPCRDQELLDAVRLAIEGHRARHKEEKHIAVLRTQFASLTAREKEVVGLVTAGLLPHATVVTEREVLAAGSHARPPFKTAEQ